MNGIIKSFNLQKGYGFINSSDSNGDSVGIFFHKSDVSNIPVFLKKDDPVVFDLVEDHRGVHAINVVKFKKFIKRN